jgi:hypothetical protein
LHNKKVILVSYLCMLSWCLVVPCPFNVHMLNLLKYALTTHEPLTNTILKSSSKNKDNPPFQFSSAARVKAFCRIWFKDVTCLYWFLGIMRSWFSFASNTYIDRIYGLIWAHCLNRLMRDSHRREEEWMSWSSWMTYIGKVRTIIEIFHIFLLKCTCKITFKT